MIGLGIKCLSIFISCTASRRHQQRQPEIFPGYRTTLQPSLSHSSKGHVHKGMSPSGFKMSVLGRRGALSVRELTLSTPVTVVSCRTRSFFVNNRPPPKYPGHVPLNFVERSALAVGSAVGALLNPRRAGRKLLFFSLLFFSLLDYP